MSGMNWIFPALVAGLGVYRLIGLKNVKQAEKRGDLNAEIEKGPFLISVVGSALMVLIGVATLIYMAMNHTLIG